MIATIMLAVAASASPVDAERAFARLAQDKGQWTAFRATAEPDAIMFVPRMSNAQEFLKPLNDPPKSVKWWPTKAWQSCDGTLAVTTGGALWPDGRHGWFTTVWRKQADGGWKWALDHGGFIEKPRPDPGKVLIVKPEGCRKVVLAPQFVGGSPNEGYSSREMSSKDRTLVATATGHPGGHTVTVRIQGKITPEIVLSDEVGSDKP